MIGFWLVTLPFQGWVYGIHREGWVSGWVSWPLFGRNDTVILSLFLSQHPRFHCKFYFPPTGFQSFSSRFSSDIQKNTTVLMKNFSSPAPLPVIQWAPKVHASQASQSHPKQKEIQRSPTRSPRQRRWCPTPTW